MQKMYPDTLDRLKNGDLTRAKTPDNLKTFTANTEFKNAVQKSNIDPSQTQVTMSTSSWFSRKRQENKLASTRSVVDEIIQESTGLLGEGGTKNIKLFPVNATHQELLGIDGKLTGKDPNTVPPELERREKWLGEALGWEHNRGLKMERKEFEDGKITLWPNPEGWNKSRKPLL